MAKTTRNDIKTAFTELLEERPITKITVKDVVERCGVNRNTFYYHFRDMPDLAEAVIEESFLEMLPEELTLYTLSDSLSAIYEAVQGNRKVLLSLYRDTDRERFEISLWRVCEYTARRYMETVTRNRRILPEDERMLLGFVHSIFFGLVMDGFRENLSREVLDRSLRIVELHQYLTEEILSRCEKKAMEVSGSKITEETRS